MTLCRGILLVVSLAVAGGCVGKDRTPEGAAELFLRAAQEGDAAEVYALLAPSVRRSFRRGHASLTLRLLVGWSNPSTCWRFGPSLGMQR